MPMPPKMPFVVSPFGRGASLFEHNIEPARVVRQRAAQGCAHPARPAPSCRPHAAATAAAAAAATTALTPRVNMSSAYAPASPSTPSAAAAGQALGLVVRVFGNLAPGASDGHGPRTLQGVQPATSVGAGRIPATAAGAARQPLHVGPCCRCCCCCSCWPYRRGCVGRPNGDAPSLGERPLGTLGLGRFGRRHRRRGAGRRAGRRRRAGAATGAVPVPMVAGGAWDRA